MAVINCSYNTETKEMSVTIDGEVKEGVRSFSCYSEEHNDERHGGCYLNFNEIKENGVKYNMSAYASKKDELKGFIYNSLHKK